MPDHPAGSQLPAAGPARARGLVAGVARAARDVGRLVLPVECPGCGRWDVLLCDGCAARLALPPVRCEEHVPRLDRMDGSAPLPVWRVAPYEGPVRGVVVSWKDRGRADLTAVLAEAVRRAAQAIAPVLRAAAAGRCVVVVPVPSSPGAARRRGADLVGVLAAAAAQGLAAAGVPAEARGMLVKRRGGRDQVGLGARARRTNTAGSIRLRAAHRTAPRRGDGGDVHLLVDDVVTTGSTLAACEDVLAADGRIVLGSLVLAATPPPSTVRRHLLHVPGED